LSPRDRPADPATFPQTIQLARSLGLKEAVPLALQGARARAIDPWNRSTAVLFVGDFGTPEEVARLEPLLKDTSSCGAAGINAITVNAEMRDVVLAALVFHSGQSLADYGFPYFNLVAGVKPSDTSPGCMGFADSASREAALKKWQAWSASHKK
jgi:hypothetical protein